MRDPHEIGATFCNPIVLASAFIRVAFPLHADVINALEVAITLIKAATFIALATATIISQT